MIRRQVQAAKALLLERAPYTVTYRVTLPEQTYLISLNEAGRLELHNHGNVDAQPGYLDRLVRHHGSSDIAHAVLWVIQHLPEADLFPSQSVGHFKPALVTPGDGP